MAFFLSPLVAVLEEDWSAIIEGASASIGAIVLENVRKGREMARVRVANADTLINTFGAPTNNEKNYLSMLTAVQALKEMSGLYCVAIKPENATFAGVKSLMSTNEYGDEIVEFEQFSSDIDSGNAHTLKSFQSTDIDNFPEEVFPQGPFDIIALSRGSWGNDVRVATVNKEVYDKIMRQQDEDAIKTHAYSQALRTLDLPVNNNHDFILMIQELKDPSLNRALDSSWALVEAYKVSTDQIPNDENGDDKFAESVLLKSNYIRFAFNENYKDKPFTVDITDWITLGGGSDGDESKNNDDLVMQAYDMFKNSEDFDVNILISGGKSDIVQKHLVSICESRKDCMCICDVPKNLVVYNKGYETSDLVEWRLGIGKFSHGDDFNISSDRCAVYANWCEVYDQWNKRYRWIPMSGFAAAAWSYTDEVAEPWFAPAGLNRGKITDIRKLAFNPYLADRDALYQACLNPVVSFAGDGPVIWGQKTMYNSTSSFSRINVRRLFLVLEKSISTYARSYLFEQNDDMTRGILSSVIKSYLSGVQGRRGINEFRVICDTTNNTALRIDRGELWCDIMIRPVRSAEFIVLRFTNTNYGTEFSEITLDNNS